MYYVSYFHHSYSLCVLTACYVSVSNAVWNEATIYDFIEDDIFFEVLYPKELGYTYRLRQAKNFGTPFVSEHKDD